MMKIFRNASKLLCSLLFATAVLPAHSAIRETFSGTTVPPAWVIGPQSSLTAATGLDPAGDGWLRLTNNTTSQVGSALLSAGGVNFAPTDPILLEFEYVSWGGAIGADGISVFLYDANASPGNMSGAYPGGSLGYCGGSGAYLGIGLDEYGNFSGPNATPGAPANPDGTCDGGAFVDGILVRGPQSANYPFIAGQNFPAGVDTPLVTTRPESSTVQMVLQPKTVGIGYTITMKLIRAGVTYTVLNGVDFPYVAPSSLRLGFGASTGTFTNNHEVRNVVFSIASAVDVTKTVQSVTGSNAIYQVTYTNNNTYPIPAGQMTFSDPLPAGIINPTWTCVGAGCSNASGSGSIQQLNAAFPVGSTVTFTVNGTLDASLTCGQTITNTASFAFDPSSQYEASTPQSASADLVVPCGTVEVAKTITGPLYSVPTTFDFDVTCTNPSLTYSSTITVPANTSSAQSSVNIRAGSTNCQISEDLASRPAAPALYSWQAPIYVLPPAVIAANTTSQATITNPLVRNQVSLPIAINVTGAPATGAPGSYGFSLVCDTGTYTGTLTVPANGTTASGSVDVPEGANCTSLVATEPTAPTNYSWGTETITLTPGPITPASTATITDPLTRNQIPVTVNVNVTGAPANGAPGSYPFTLVCDTGTYTGTVNITGTSTVGTATVLVPEGANCPTLNEPAKPTAPTNYSWGTETTTPPAGPIAPGSTATITNPLTRNQVSLTVNVNITGAPASGAPGSYPFTLVCDTGTYTGTVTLTGTATSGTTSITVPEGANCTTLTENSKPTAPANYTWGPETTTPPAGPVVNGSTATITNPLTRNLISVPINVTVPGAPATGAPGTYSFTLVCDTGTYTGTVTLTGTSTAGTGMINNVPEGANCTTLTETSKPAAPDTYAWGPVTATPPAGPIGPGSTGSISNPLTRNLISVTISVNVTGAPATGAPGSYPFTLVCDTGTYTGTITLTGSSTTGSSTVNVPEGATCSTLTEPSKPTAPATYAWGPETATPPAGPIAPGSTGTITNPLTRNLIPVTVNLTVPGAPATGAPGSYPFTLVCDTGTYTGVVTLTGTSTTGTGTVNVPEGANCTTLTETGKPTAPTSYNWGPETTTPPVGPIAPGSTASISNPLTRNQIPVTITVNVAGAPAAGAPGSYPFTLVCDTGTYTGTVTITGTATSGTATVNVPEGANCTTLTENSKPTAPTSYNWGPETTTPPAGPITTGSNGVINNQLNAPSLTVSITPDKTVVVPGTPVTYVVDVSNGGPVNSDPNTTIVISVPAGEQVTRAIPGNGWVCSPTTGTGPFDITCVKAAGVPAGAAKEPVLTLVVTKTTPADVTNTARVTSGDAACVSAPAAARCAGSATVTSSNPRVAEPVPANSLAMLLLAGLGLMGLAFARFKRS